MKQYEPFELTFSGPELTGDCVHVDIQAEFRRDGEQTTVPGFYCGSGIYKVRFLPKHPGIYSWRVTGMVSGEGTEECAAPEDDNHGMVKADGTAFRFEDGKLFHPFGTTVYALISQTEELIDQTMDTLSKAPFNKIRMCVFPKDYEFNKNEPPYYPFQRAADGSWDTARPSYPFWDALDRHIVQLSQMGIQVDLILFHPYDRWGFDGMGLVKDKTYLDYLLRRLAAYPNLWWSLANEYELTNRSMEDWYKIEAFIAERDPYGHLLSCHNIFNVWDASRPRTTHASIQSKDLSMLSTWQKRFGKPVMLDECAYEGDIEPFWGSITGAEMTRRFWKAVSVGAYCTHGETFYDDKDVLWWSKGGVLKGESPARIAFCRRIIESLPGHLEGEPSFLTRLIPLLTMDEATRETMLASIRINTPDQHAAEGLIRLVRAFIASGEDAKGFGASETAYYGHIGTDCYLRFHDTRPIRRDTVELPADKTYTIWLIDTWNMTIETVATGVSGKYTIPMPGKENMAVLILAE